MQDLILTTKGGTAGVVPMEWNVAASHQGSAALWGMLLSFLMELHLCQADYSPMYFD
jgi:hypothetical protein